jgi:hypothetical protein
MRQARVLAQGRHDVLLCVEINRCVGCTRQFFTKSYLGDDAAILARSSGEELASPRHRAGVASMTRRPRTRRKNLISTQVLLLAYAPIRRDEPDAMHGDGLSPSRPVVPAGAEPHRRGRARVVASPRDPAPQWSIRW